jgi:FtsH-binding integral membrane protein
MRLNLLKAIKSTHKNPISRTLHLMGLSLYIAGFALIVCYYFDNSVATSSPVYGIILFPIAVCLFLIGHKIEGNLRAMTLIIIIKYLRSKLRLKK